MKIRLLLLCLAIIALTAQTFAQLPPVAQALYDEAVAQDAQIVNYALNAGAQVLATPDGNSFYVQWFPQGQQPSTPPLIVSLHGSDGFAFHEFFNWHSEAMTHGCGIIALQWYRGDSAVVPYDYFPDDTLYSYIDSALTRIQYPSGKAFLHGFSRGGARTYAMIFHDIQSGNNYFCTTMANAGGADLNYPLYAQIDSGNYGPNVFAGKHWNFFCGGLDPNPNQSGCPGMSNTETWLQGQGATVDIFIQDPSLGHDGFQLQTATSLGYRDSILDGYVGCFNGVTGFGEEHDLKAMKVFPNPMNGSATLLWGFDLLNGRLCVYDLNGREVERIDGLQGREFQWNGEALPDGVYWMRLMEGDDVKRIAKVIFCE